MDQRSYDQAVRAAQAWRQAKSEAVAKASNDRARIDQAMRNYYAAKARGAKS